MKPYAENRKARHDYEFMETFEGGLVLDGSEVKSVREGGAKLEGSYIKLMRGELWLVGAQIRPYSKMGKREEYDPERRRKILVTTKELRKLTAKLEQKGLTLVPISFYPLRRRIKVSFALGRGKKAHDKRDSIKERDRMRHARRYDE
jgi:SsrA-binding protein